MEGMHNFNSFSYVLLYMHCFRLKKKKKDAVLMLGKLCGYNIVYESGQINCT